LARPVHKTEKLYIWAILRKNKRRYMFLFVEVYRTFFVDAKSFMVFKMDLIRSPKSYFLLCQN